MKITLLESGRAELAPWLIGYVGGEIRGGTESTQRVIPARPNCFIQIILCGGHAMLDVESGTKRWRTAGRAVRPVDPLPLQHGSSRTICGPFRRGCSRPRRSQLFGDQSADLVDTFAPITLPSGLLETLQAAESWQAMVASGRCLAGATSTRQARIRCRNPCRKPSARSPRDRQRTGSGRRVRAVAAPVPAPVSGADRAQSQTLCADLPDRPGSPSQRI